MTTKTKSQTPTKKFTYLRIPLDDNLNNDLQTIIDNNPYFSQVDAAKFAIGRYMKQEFRAIDKKSNLAINLDMINKKTFAKELSETEANEILTNIGL